jgi:hypothetical protein
MRGLFLSLTDSGWFFYRTRDKTAQTHAGCIWWLEGIKMPLQLAENKQKIGCKIFPILKFPYLCPPIPNPAIFCLFSGWQMVRIGAEVLCFELPKSVPVEGSWKPPWNPEQS